LYRASVELSCCLNMHTVVSHSRALLMLQKAILHKCSVLAQAKLVFTPAGAELSLP
jgi:hypothetical protein